MIKPIRRQNTKNSQNFSDIYSPTYPFPGRTTHSEKEMIRAFRDLNKWVMRQLKRPRPQRRRRSSSSAPRLPSRPSDGSGIATRYVEPCATQNFWSFNITVYCVPLSP